MISARLVSLLGFDVVLVTLHVSVVVFILRVRSRDAMIRSGYFTLFVIRHYSLADIAHVLMARKRRYITAEWRLEPKVAK